MTVYSAQGPLRVTRVMTLRSGPRSCLIVILVALAFLLVAGASASAHENRLVGEETVTLGPGQEHTVPVELHYHRLVGHVQTAGMQDAQIVVRVIGPDDEPRTVAGPDSDYVVDALVPCCKGDFWTPHTIVIANEGTGPVELEYRLVLLHDGFAVIAEDAEPGALVTTLFPFLVVSGLLAWRWWRGPPLEGDPRKLAYWSIGLHTAMWLIAGTMAILGMFRYSSGPVSGAIAAAADLPWLDNEILTTQDLVLGSGIILWIISVILWTRAARRPQKDRSVAIIGIVMGNGSLLACLLWVIDYGYLLAPILVGVSTAMVPLGGGVVLLRRTHGVPQGPGTEGTRKPVSR